MNLLNVNISRVKKFKKQKMCGNGNIKRLYTKTKSINKHIFDELKY